MVLGYAQKAAYNRMKPSLVRDEKGKLTRKMGFVDVTHEGVNTVLDYMAYQKIHYVPPHTYMTGSLFIKMLMVLLN